MEKGISYFKREKWIYLALLTVMGMLIGKLFWLQIVNASDLESRGLERRTIDSKVLAQRGTIYDSQGRVLAQSIPVKEIYLDPQTFKQYYKDPEVLEARKDQFAKQLSEILNQEYENIRAQFDKEVSWTRLVRYADLDLVSKIKELGIPGIGFTDVQQRVYPLNTIASQVLGIVNFDGNGAEGLEYTYDDILFGQLSYSSQEIDTGSRSIFRAGQTTHQDNDGNNLHLTLHSGIQFVVEQQLDLLLEQTRADRITILAMDPMTGKILAMGSRPSFNANEFLTSTPEQRKNLTISFPYEPGSTFKIITGAAALEEGILRPDDVYNDPGYLRVGNRTITNWDSDYKSHGKITFAEAMQRSSNVVLAQVGEKLGKEKFYTYLRAFGFGEKTNIDLMGEDSGLILPYNEVRPIDLATMSFGQTNLVTPIQLLTAICAIANGGTLYQPYIVEKITSSSGEVVEHRQPNPIRQVISAKTAAQMTEILEGVVNNGTGSRAKIPGIRVAGKTGTAQKVDPEKGGYSEDQFIASFAAFAPADDPKIAVLVVIDNPKGESHQGGTLGAPVAKEIIKQALTFFGVPVDSDTTSEIIADKNQAHNQSFVSEKDPNEEVKPEREPEANEIVVPDFKGMTMREAGQILSDYKLRFHFQGTGIVSKQTPSPGSIVKEGSLIELTFTPVEEFSDRVSEVPEKPEE